MRDVRPTRMGKVMVGRSYIFGSMKNTDRFAAVPESAGWVISCGLAVFRSGSAMMGKVRFVCCVS